MSYSYQAERDKLFTDEGQRLFLAVMNSVSRSLATAGAVRATEAWKGAQFGAADTFTLSACLDRMVELGEIREVTGHGVAGQDRVFVKARGR